MVMKLDIRFADEDDSQDIVAVVSAAFAVEHNKGDERAFRKPITLTETEVCTSVWGPSSRWLVCETPVPEEKMVGCLHMRMDSSTHTAYITHLAVDPATQRKGVGTQLLRRAESIVRSFTCRYVEIETVNWREDVMSFLGGLGYRECGGCLWPQARANELIKPSTRLVKYKKDLMAGSTMMVDQHEELQQATASSDMDMLSSVMEMVGDLGLGQDDGDDMMEIGGGQEGQGNRRPPMEDGNGESLEDLVCSLFKQLRTPEGRMEFERLCINQEEDELSSKMATAMDLSGVSSQPTTLKE